jgi:hypothetical protein
LKRLSFGTVVAAAALVVSGCESTAQPPAATPTTSAASTSASSAPTPSTPSGQPDQWAPRESALITPGIEAYTGNDQCTTNFVFTDNANNVYIGQAAHCASKGTGRDTNGCSTQSQPLGTAVTFNKPSTPKTRGAQLGKGELAYSSWIAMQSDGEKDKNTCAYNDFALVKIDADSIGKVNPTVPEWGGPVGINTNGTTEGETLYSYGNSSLRFGIKTFSRQIGKAKATDPAVGGWSHQLTSEKHDPGIPGDSGSAYLDHAGNAVGTLSTLGISIPVVNSIGDLSHELAYAQAHSKIAGLQLVMGTAPFTPK